MKYAVGAITMLYILYNRISCICFRNKVLLLLFDVNIHVVQVIFTWC